MNILTSWDDGSKHDIKLAQLLKQYHLPGIFFIPSNCEIVRETVRYLIMQGFEVGGHTVSHPNDMKELTLEDQVYEIGCNKGWLEGLTGKELEWFCYPSGRYNETTIEALEICGFKKARTTLVGNTDNIKDPFRIATSVHVYPNRVEYNGRPWYEVAKELYKEAKEKDGTFHLWGHSWEVEKFGLWDELERFFKAITE